MRRLIILTIGFGITYLFYISLQNSAAGVWFPPVFFIGSFTLALAFLEPFGMKFHKFIARAIEFFTLPRLRIWDKRYSENEFFKYISYSDKQWKKFKNKQDPEEDLYNLKQQQKTKVEELSVLLDTDLKDFSEDSIIKYRETHKKTYKKDK
jgi:hypothetical protein